MNSTERPRILIVDDEEDICQILKSYLEVEGFQTVLANNAKQALELTSKKNPDLLIIDVVLPDMDGYALARELRDNEKTFLTPVIMMSARKKDYKDKLSGFLSGACDYLTKPFKKEELLASVTKVLSV